MSHENFGNKNVYILNFGKVSITNQTKPAQSTAKRVQSCRCEVCAVRQAMRKKQSFYKASGFSGRGGRCVAGWLLVRGLFAMRGPMRAGWLHSRGALRCTGCNAMRCDARDAMREPMRCTGCGLFAIQCDARGLVAFAVQASPCF